ncbi:MAG TPA: DegV family protein, partial [bacterium]|nr:DegV family protein [bacterium]
ASVGLGLIALLSARLARRGAGVQEVVRAIGTWSERTTITFSVASLEYLRRGGRISAAQAVVGNLLGLRPVLHWAGERVQAVDRARGARDAFAKVMARVARDAPPGTRIRAGLIAASDATDRLDEVERRLREEWDVVELLRGGITGVIGAHTGPGTWAVVIQRVDDDDPLLADGAAP